jgi:23S rRNA pseudouridine2457 synthase
MVIAFHKPYGVISQFRPELPGQRTFADFGFPRDVYPVGRLDLDSEGLILLSDEKGFTDRLLNPRAAHPRTYHVQVEGAPDDQALEPMRRGGLRIQGHSCLPCLARVPDPAPDYPPRDPPVRFRKLIPTTWIELTLIEGKNRQVRRMTAACGFPTLRLIRAAIGKYQLADLAPGAWIELSSGERELLAR